MIITRADLPHLRRSLLGLLLAAVAGGVAILYVSQVVGQAERELHAAQQRLDVVRSQLAAASAERDDLRDYAAEYTALLQRNIIGDDRRLERVAAIEGLRMQSRLPEFSYSIAPRQPFALSRLHENKDFEPGISGVSMQFGLLHEGQLVAFLDGMRNDVPGRFVLERCAVERGEMLLKAECTGGWLTLKKRAAQ